MRRTLLALTIVAGAVGGTTLAHHDEHGKDNVKVLSQREITEKIDGKKAKATTVEVTLEPGQAGAPYRHPGPAFGYVLEGEYEWGGFPPRDRGSTGNTRSGAPRWGGPWLPDGSSPRTPPTGRDDAPSPP